MPSMPVGAVISIIGFMQISGYLHTFSEQLLINLDQLPGDERTKIGFIGVDATLHFFQFNNPDKPPRHLVVDDVTGRPDSLRTI